MAPGGDVADNVSSQPAASKLLNGLILREGVQQQSARRDAAHRQNDFGLAHLDLHAYHTMHCLELLACQRCAFNLHLLVD